MEIQLPLRQKILLLFTFIMGVLVLLLYNLKIVDKETMQMIIFFYLFIVPFFLLTSDTLIDLNNNQIFNIWLIIGLIYFLIYFMVRYTTGIWIAPLKSLLSFLIAYKILNTIMKKTTGWFILNTFRQYSWKHDIVKRKIIWLDVVFNILLLIVLLLSIFK